MKNKAVAIPGYIDIKRISDLISNSEILALDKGWAKIAYVGRLSLEKNVELMLEAVSIVAQKQKISVYVVGDGPELIKIQKFIKKGCENAKINLMGYMDNPYSVISQCDCLISSSRYEGFGLTAVEAMACGTPVVSVDNGGGDGDLFRRKIWNCYTDGC